MGQPHPAQISAYDRDVLAGTEATLERGGPSRVEFDRDHPGAGPYECGRQRPGSGSQIDNEIGIGNAGSGDHVPSGPLIEGMKSPADTGAGRPAPSPGHDAP